MDLPRKFHANFMCLVRGVSYCNEEAVKPEEFYHRQYQGRRRLSLSRDYFLYHVIVVMVTLLHFVVLICFFFRYAA